MKTIRNQKRTKLLTVLLCVCMMLLMLPQIAFAAGSGALTIHGQKDGVQVNLYHVTEESTGRETWTDAFAGCSIQLPGADANAAERQEAAQKLQKYVEDTNPTPTKSGTISGRVVKFDGLAEGLYLVLGDSYKDGGSSYNLIPVLVRVSDAKIDVYSKGEPDDPDDPDDPGKPSNPKDPDDPDDPDDPGKPSKPEDPDDPDDPDDPGDPSDPDNPDDPYIPEDPGDPGNPDEPDTPGNPNAPDKPNQPVQPGLPQTGQLWWPVLLMGVAGVLLVLLGMAGRLRRKREK